MRSLSRSIVKLKKQSSTHEKDNWLLLMIILKAACYASLITDNPDNTEYGASHKYLIRTIIFLETCKGLNE